MNFERINMLERQLININKLYIIQTKKKNILEKNCQILININEKLKNDFENLKKNVENLKKKYDYCICNSDNKIVTESIELQIIPYPPTPLHKLSSKDTSKYHKTHINSKSKVLQKLNNLNSLTIKNKNQNIDISRNILLFDIKRGKNLKKTIIKTTNKHKQTDKNKYDSFGCSITDACIFNATTIRGQCTKHDSKTVACSVEGCSTNAAERGLCKKHGTIKICSFDN